MAAQVNSSAERSYSKYKYKDMIIPKQFFLLQSEACRYFRTFMHSNTNANTNTNTEMQKYGEKKYRNIRKKERREVVLTYVAAQVNRAVRRS